MDVLTDWHITAQPPLTLRNDLPVAAHYVLWERPARGGSLVLRQQGRLEGWASINVYSVDMRQQVRLLLCAVVAGLVSVQRTTAQTTGAPQLFEHFHQVHFSTVCRIPTTQHVWPIGKHHQAPVGCYGLRHSLRTQLQQCECVLPRGVLCFRCA